MDFSKTLNYMQKTAKSKNAPVYEFTKHFINEFQILVSAILSTRTKDQTTNKVCNKLFAEIKTPKQLLELDEHKLENLLYGVGFYKTKAKNLKKCCSMLITNFNAKVPHNFNDLIKLPGVGRKVANVFLTAINIPTIAVDVHVHRISNRLGWVKTKTPEQTELELKKLVPKKLWKHLNQTLVAFGQTTCLPKKPKCNLCKLSDQCAFFKARQTKNL